MSVAGPCDICLSGTVEHTCDRCGNLVCTDHFDESTCFCLACVRDVGGGNRDSQPDTGDTYRF